MQKGNYQNIRVIITHYPTINHDSEKREGESVATRGEIKSHGRVLNEIDHEINKIKIAIQGFKHASQGVKDAEV